MKDKKGDVKYSFSSLINMNNDVEVEIAELEFIGSNA